ncbi:MAG: tRNA (cytidine(34)-2'-O)-methyltransferase [Alphaproteobacteria bacterium]|nr:tRNA (cytidine(34)-2'-O)-methyltransferase [Alphaproteobacteria bacterium]
MRLALYQPDIPQNAGAMLRLGACFGVAVDIIEPCGFVLDDRRMRRAGMDYIDRVAIARHVSWDRFAASAPGRIVLLTTRGDIAHDRFAWRPGDVLLMGRESAGVPAEIHRAAAARVAIPTAPGIRSLNVAQAAAIALAEALRQTGGLPRACEAAREEIA